MKFFRRFAKSIRLHAVQELAVRPTATLNDDTYVLLHRSTRFKYRAFGPPAVAQAPSPAPSMFSTATLAACAKIRDAALTTMITHIVASLPILPIRLGRGFPVRPAQPPR